MRNEFESGNMVYWFAVQFFNWEGNMFNGCVDGWWIEKDDL